MENNRTKGKAARYAIVYNKILKMIHEGVYPEGSKLMSEPYLAQQMQVSRSTLRQALNLLQEDGIIEAKRGVGNFVRKSVDLNANGLEKMSNPIIKSCTDELQHIKIEVTPGIATEYTQRIFHRKMPLVLAMHRFYVSENYTAAYCFSHVAGDSPCLNSVDLSKDDCVLDFMENKIYDFVQSRRCDIKVVPLSDNLKSKDILNEQGLFQMIHEELRTANGDVVAVSKYYIPIEKALIKVYSSN